MTNHQMPFKIHTLIVSAGVGSRFGGDMPKQYTTVNLSDFGVLISKTILQFSVSALAKCDVIDHITLVVADDDGFVRNLDFELPVSFVAGGLQRFDSVKNGLLHIAKNASQDDYVLIHDAVRPCVPVSDIVKLVDFVSTNQPIGAILATPVADTLKLAKSVHDLHTPPMIDSSVSRHQLWQALTPQMFHLQSLLTAIDSLSHTQSVDITDEASVFDYLGLDGVCLIQGSRSNLKLTYPSDLPIIQALLASHYLCST